VQVDPIKPTLKAPGTVRLKPNYDKLLSSFAFNFNLRRYNVALLNDVHEIRGYNRLAGGNRTISVYRLGEMPIQNCGQSVSARRVKAVAGLNAHTELRAKRQRSAWEAIYRNRPIESKYSTDAE
jgi:hypothetical protein